jgi:hypothetical protein
MLTMRTLDSRPHQYSAWGLQACCRRPHPRPIPLCRP